LWVQTPFLFGVAFLFVGGKDVILKILLSVALTQPTAEKPSRLSLEEVEEVIAFNESRFRACWPKTKLNAPLKINLGILLNGTVNLTALLSDSNPPIAACFTKALQDIRFPPRDSESQYQIAVAQPIEARPQTEIPVFKNLSSESLEKSIWKCGLLVTTAPSPFVYSQSLDVLVGKSGVVLNVTADEREPTIAKCAINEVFKTRFPFGETQRRFQWVAGAQMKVEPVIEPPVQPKIADESDLIGEVFESHKKDITFCNRKHLMPYDLQGSIHWYLTIGDDGKLRQLVALSNDTGSDDVVECLKDEMKTWIFRGPQPSADGGVEGHKWKLTFVLD
jgi:hypothetical protein